MMNIEEIKELMKAFDESKSVSLRLELEGVKISLKKERASESHRGAVKEKEPFCPAEETGDEPLKEASEGTAEEGEIVKAPLVGVFYAAPSPEKPAFVQVGDVVEEGETLCLIEAMKMMNELKAPKRGRVKKIYVKNQDVVGFDDRLFLIGEE